MLSLRKRAKWLSFGGFESWRLIHIAAGFAAIAALFVHTGFRLGHNLNSWLMISFLIVAWVLFLAIRWMNRLRRKEDPEAKKEEPKPEPPKDIQLLTEIRDELRRK